MKSITGVSLYSLAIAAGLSAPFSPALAQPTAQAAADDAGVEEIVVTAQRRAENLQSVPISVSAITAGTLAKSGVTNTIQLNQVVPSVQISRSGPQTIFFVRGVGNAVSNIGEEGANAFYIDGVYLGDLASIQTEFNNIERIEVLKGPQGTLFGRNSSGGLINIITREPGDEVVVKANVGYGNYKTKRGQLYVASPLTDKLSFDIALTAKDQDRGWGINKATGGDYALGWNWGGRIKTVWRPGDATKITWSADIKRANENHYQGFAVFKGSVSTGGFGYEGDYNVNSVTPGFAKVKAWGTSLNIQQEFDWATLTSITARRYIRVDSGLDADTTPAQLTFADVQSRTRSFQQEVRLASNSTTPLSWQIGAFYYQANAKLLGQTVTGLGVGGLGRGLRIVAQLKTDSIAGFGEITYALTPSTHITGGLRYTTEKRDYFGFQQEVNQIPGSALFNAFTLPRIDRSSRFNKLTYRVAVRQDLNDNVNVYGSYNRGFKSGIYPLNATPNAMLLPVKPQTIDAFEVGVKSELFDRTLRLNLAAFHYKVKDYQIRSAAPGGLATTILLNAATVKVDGVEAEFEWVPVRGLRFSGNATYLDSRFGSFPSNAFTVPRTVDNVAAPCVRGTGAPTGGGVLCFGPATGNRTPLSPKFAAALGVTHTMDVGDEGQLITNLHYNYTGSIFFEADNNVGQPSFSILNGAIEYRPSPSWGVEFFMQNITDKQYYITGLIASVGTQGVLGPPRTYGVNLKFDF